MSETVVELTREIQMPLEQLAERQTEEDAIMQEFSREHQIPAEREKLDLPEGWTYQVDEEGITNIRSPNYASIDSSLLQSFLSPTLMQRLRARFFGMKTEDLPKQSQKPRVPKSPRQYIINQRILKPLELHPPFLRCTNRIYNKIDFEKKKKDPYLVFKTLLRRIEQDNYIKNRPTNYYNY